MEQISLPFASPGWDVRTKYDSEARQLADRHYSRRTPGAPQFAPPGQTLILVRPGALWISRIERREKTKHAWPGAWQNSLFRNEGGGLSSQLVREAVAATIEAWGPIPPEGFLTMVDPGKVRSTNPGCCYLHAGWRRIGWTEGGHGRPKLLVLMLGGPEQPAPGAAPPPGWTSWTGGGPPLRSTLRACRSRL